MLKSALNRQYVSLPVRFLLHTLYTVVVMTLIVLLGIWLMSGLGTASIYVFVRNDVLPNTDLVIFLAGLSFIYLVSSLVCRYQIKVPQFDFFSRIFAVNFIVYSFAGLALSVSRIPLFSRTVVLSTFILSTLLLFLYFFLRHRLYPQHLAVLADIDITPFQEYPLLKISTVQLSDSNIQRFDGIIANLHDQSNSETSRFLAQLAQQRIPVYDANSMVEILWGRIPLVNLTAAEVELFTPPQLYSAIKRVGELGFVVLLSPLLILLGLMISCAIKLDSRGPVFFSQYRTGLHGTSFILFKFRSMHTSASGESRFAEEGDKRITRVGRILRRLRLDELPQMWNVLKGDMSLIGPRPEQLDFATRFDRLIPFYGFRHTIRPGITGWAQVMSGYSASDGQTQTKLEYDFFYIKHMSIWLDLITLFKTLRTILLGTGAR